MTHKNPDGFFRIIHVALSRSNGEELKEITLEVSITKYF